MDAIFYTVRSINGDYAVTMFLLPEGTTLGSRLKLEDFQWELV